MISSVSQSSNLEGIASGGHGGLFEVVFGVSPTPDSGTSDDFGGLLEGVLQALSELNLCASEGFEGFPEKIVLKPSS